MAKVALSDASLRSIKAPTKGQSKFWDDKLPGFGVRVSQGGSKTFVLNRDNTLITIGRYPILSLAEARGEAKRLLAEFTLGRIRPETISFEKALDLFIEDKKQANRRPRTIEGYRRVIGLFGFRGPLAQISHAEAARRYDRINAPSERSHALVGGKVFFSWCIKRRYISENPLAGLSKPVSAPRTRVLTDDELRKIWYSAEGHFGNIVKLAILTGQRRGELSELKPQYVSGDLCTLPGTLTKNHRQHCFPIGKMAQEVLAKFEYKPFTNWSQAKATLDKASGTNGWTVHDIRRTVATNMARMGVSLPTVEKLLNHISGSFGGIVGIYQQHDFMPEMRKAVDGWEERLFSLLTVNEPRNGKYVSFERRAVAA